MSFQDFSPWFNGFKVYDTPYRHFFEYQTGAIAYDSFEAMT